MLTGRQIREARKLLGWGRIRFSRSAQIPETLIEAVESSEGPAWLTDEQGASIRCACEGSGIRFEIDAEGLAAAVVAGSLS